MEELLWNTLGLYSGLHSLCVCVCVCTLEHHSPVHSTSWFVVFRHRRPKKGVVISGCAPTHLRTSTEMLIHNKKNKNKIKKQCKARYYVEKNITNFTFVMNLLIARCPFIIAFSKTCLIKGRWRITYNIHGRMETFKTMPPLILPHTSSSSSFLPLSSCPFWAHTKEGQWRCENEGVYAALRVCTHTHTHAQRFSLHTCSADRLSKYTQCGFDSLQGFRC